MSFIYLGCFLRSGNKYTFIYLLFIRIYTWELQSRGVCGGGSHGQRGGNLLHPVHAEPGPVQLQQTSGRRSERNFMAIIFSIFQHQISLQFHIGFAGKILFRMFRENLFSCFAKKLTKILEMFSKNQTFCKNLCKNNNFIIFTFYTWKFKISMDFCCFSMCTGTQLVTRNYYYFKN